MRVVILYRRQGGKLPIYVERLVNYRKWSQMSEWPQVQASITGTRICFPKAKIRNFMGIGVPPATIEVSYQFDVNGSQYEGKFSVAFVGTDWATMATQNAVGEKVKIQFDPKNPKDCVPVEKEWLGFVVWSVG